MVNRKINLVKKGKSEIIFSGRKNKRKISTEIKNLCHSEKDKGFYIFGFIEEKALQKRLIKSFDEANFVNTLIKVLSINYYDSHPFNEIQIIHYASICEGVLGSIFKTNESLRRERVKNKDKDKLGVLCQLNIISDDIEKDIRLLWELRNNIHLHKAKLSDIRFFKKHITNKKDIIVNFCKLIDSYLNKETTPTLRSM
jgi:hypothetical protein